MITPCPSILTGRYFCRSFQRFFYRPTIISPTSIVCSPAYTKVVNPLREIFSLSINSNESDFTRIIYLLFLSCPSTIIWGIIAVIVYTVYAVSRGWFVFHIIYEIFKSFFLIRPSFTNFYSSASIVSVRGIRFVVASAHHSSIAAVFVLPIHVTTMLIFRIVFAAKCYFTKTFSTAFTRIFVPSRSITLKLISAVTFYCKRPIPIRRVLMKLTYNLECAFPIHNNIIPQKEFVWL